MLLPETDDHPVRPDLPWLRNLSWVKIHAMQIGIGIAIMIYWGQSIGLEGTAYGIGVLAASAIFGKYQERRQDCDHALGIHDFVLKPWYGLFTAIACYLAMTYYWGVVI